jgi:hypothetical protein
MKKTKVKAHRRKGTGGVRSHYRMIAKGRRLFLAPVKKGDTLAPMFTVPHLSKKDIFIGTYKGEDVKDIAEGIGHEEMHQELFKIDPSASVGLDIISEPHTGAITVNPQTIRNSYANHLIKNRSLPGVNVTYDVMKNDFLVDKDAVANHPGLAADIVTDLRRRMDEFNATRANDITNYKLLKGRPVDDQLRIINMSWVNPEFLKFVKRK